MSAPLRAHGEIVAAVCVAAPLLRVESGNPGAAFSDLVRHAGERIEKLIDAR